MPAKTLLIVGSGPGIALQTALLFASKGFTHIALISRTQANLDKTKSTITSAHPTVTVSTHACDVSDLAALTSTLAATTAALSGAPQVILFNAANITPSTIGAAPPARLLSDFATTTAALYSVACALLPAMLALPRPALLVTGGHIHHTPFPPFFSLSAAKAAQFNLSAALAAVYGPQGVVVGTVVINGIVEVEGSGEMSAANIAAVLWGVFEEGSKEGKGEEDKKKGEMSVKEVGRVEDFLRIVGGG